MRAALLRSGLPALLAVLVSSQAQAGLFDDEEARRAINDMKVKNEARFDQQSKAQLDLASQLQRQAEEIATLRGQIESLNYELDNTKKRQQDLYVDLDTRLRKLETGGPAATAAAGGEASAANPAAAGGPTGVVAAAADPTQEAPLYEAAINQFKAGRYKEAAVGFATLVQKYPDGQLAPNAQFWLANTWRAQGNCYKAIEQHSLVVSKYGNSPKAPDAMVGIADCQKELGNLIGSRRTMENLVARYPTAPAADTARERLKKK